MPTVLLHTCCAPCASACVERLREAGHEVTLFFSNANIADPAEFARRLASVCRLAEYLAVPLLVDPADHADWRRAVAGCEAEPEGGARCRRCFAYSLRRTAGRAAEIGAARFATSLTVSPHKRSAVLFEEGLSADPLHFLAEDFKKREGFRRSVELSRLYGLYRQTSCGCEFSAAPGRGDGQASAS